VCAHQLQVLNYVSSGPNRVPIAIEIPDAWLTAPTLAAPSTAPRTEAELDALTRRCNPGTPFSFTSIKQVALDSETARCASAFSRCCGRRYRLAEILSGEARTAGDPLRELFHRRWSELARSSPTLSADACSTRSPLRTPVYRFRRCAAGAGSRRPGLAMTLSVDGLRQHARACVPGRAAIAGLRLGRRRAVCSSSSTLKDLYAVPAPPGRSWLDLFIRARTPRPSWINGFHARRAGRLRNAGRRLAHKTSATELSARISPRPTTDLSNRCRRRR